MRSVASRVSSASQAASRFFLEDVAEALCCGVSRPLPPLAECTIFGYLQPLQFSVSSLLHVSSPESLGMSSSAWIAVFQTSQQQCYLIRSIDWHEITQKILLRISC